MGRRRLCPQQNLPSLYSTVEAAATHTKQMGQCGSAPSSAKKPKNRRFCTSTGFPNDLHIPQSTSEFLHWNSPLISNKLIIHLNLKFPFKTQCPQAKSFLVKQWSDKLVSYVNKLLRLTNYDKLGGLKQLTHIPCLSGGQKSEMSFPELKLRTGKGRVSLEGSRRESLSWPFPASGGVFVHLLARVGPSIFKASSTASSNHCSIFTCPLLSPAPLFKGPCDYTQKPCESSRVISYLKTLN